MLYTKINHIITQPWNSTKTKYDLMAKVINVGFYITIKLKLNNVKFYKIHILHVTCMKKVTWYI